MWFGEAGLIKKVETGIVTFPSCLSVHFLPTAACSGIGQSPPQDSGRLPSHLPIPVSQEG